MPYDAVHLSSGSLRQIKTSLRVARRLVASVARWIVMIDWNSVFRRMRRFLRQSFGAGLVALLVIAQASATVDGCFMERAADGHDSGAVSADAHHVGVPDIHCVTEPGVEAQAPAPENKQVLAGYAAGAPLVLRQDDSHRPNERIARFEPSATGLSYVLQFQRLRI